MAESTITAKAYFDATPATYKVVARSEQVVRCPLGASSRWYDFSVRVAGRRRSRSGWRAGRTG